MSSQFLSEETAKQAVSGLGQAQVDQLIYGTQSPVSLKTATLDGKRIGYNSETLFLVQVRSPKGHYQTRYSFRGNLGQAILYFNSINLGYGWRKRLISPGLTPKALLAQAVG